MLVRDVMTAKVITVPSSAPLADVKRLMDDNKIKRLPVVDGGKLVGLVTRNAVDREMSSMLSTLTASDFMVRHLVTVPDSATVEEAVGTAQAKRVGALLVVKGTRLAGIATTNDFFYKILNPLLGIAVAGSRVAVRKVSGGPDVEKIFRIINGLGVGIASSFTMKRPGGDELMFAANLEVDNPAAVVAALKKEGFEVETRKR